MAAVDAKRRYMGMCNGRSAQQESGAALSKEQHVYGGGAKNYIQLLYYAVYPESKSSDSSREKILKFSIISVK